jgi:hypothetical protein
MSLGRKIICGALGVGAMLLATSTGGYGYVTPDSLTTGTVVTASGNLKFNEDIDGIPVTVTCPHFTATGTVAGPARLHFAPSPTINRCTDSLGGSDTITTNSTHGSWYFTSGSAMRLRIPKAGAIFSSNVLSGCRVTWAPTASVQLAGSYNGVKVETITNQPLAATGTGCTAGKMTVSVLAVMSPAPGVVPPWN